VIWSDNDRRELRELCRAHDRFMAEARYAEHQSEPVRRPYVRRNAEGDELVYREAENALLSAPTSDAEPFSEEQRDVIVRVVAMLQDQEEANCEKGISALRAEIAELRGKVDMLTAILAGDRTKSVVIDLPNWRRKDVA